MLRLPDNMTTEESEAWVHMYTCALGIPMVEENGDRVARHLLAQRSANAFIFESRIAFGKPGAAPASLPSSPPAGRYVQPSGGRRSGDESRTVRGASRASQQG
jgi:hypothetical protein